MKDKIIQNIAKNKHFSTAQIMCVQLAILSCIITLISSLLFSSSSCLPTCYAEGENYYLVKANTVLEITTGGNEGRIVIPKSYYVKQLKDSSSDVPIDGVTYREIEYNNIRGLVDVNNLSSKTISTVENPYYKPSDLTQTATENNVFIYSAIPSVTISGESLDSEIKLQFIAYPNDDEKYIFVKTLETNVRYGFVLSSLYTPKIIIEPNPNPVDPDNSPIIPDDPTVPGGETVTPPETANIVRIVLITLLCLLAVLVVFLIYKPTTKKKPSRDDFYEV